MKKEEKEIGRLLALLAARDIPLLTCAARVQEQLDKAAVANHKSGLLEAAEIIRNRKQSYIDEHGSTDPETGTVEFPKGGDEYVGEMLEIEEAILHAANQKKDV